MGCCNKNSDKKEEEVTQLNSEINDKNSSQESVSVEAVSSKENSAKSTADTNQKESGGCSCCK